jgi:hypothetical protein
MHLVWLETQYPLDNHTVLREKIILGTRNIFWGQKSKIWGQKYLPKFLGTRNIFWAQKSKNWGQKFKIWGQMNEILGTNE